MSEAAPSNSAAVRRPGISRRRGRDDIDMPVSAWGRGAWCLEQHHPGQQRRKRAGLL